MEWKVSDMIAILTIAGGVLSYTHSMYKEREIKVAEHADKVRSSAAQLLGKLNALHNAVPNSALEARQVVVEAKIGLLKTYEPRKALHALWGNLLKEKGKAIRAISDLQTDASYLAFYTFHPFTKRCVDDALHQIESDLSNGYMETLAAVEEARLKMPEDKKDYVPARLYNQLAGPIQEMEVKAIKTTKEYLEPIEAHLIDVIGRSNTSLTAESLQREKVQCKSSGAQEK